MIVFISVWILGSLLSFAIMELLDWSARANKRKRDDLAHATLTLANVKQEITRRGRK